MSEEVATALFDLEEPLRDAANIVQDSAIRSCRRQADCSGAKA